MIGGVGKFRPGMGKTIPRYPLRGIDPLLLCWGSHIIFFKELAEHLPPREGWHGDCSLKRQPGWPG